jgi:hypothetical protein
MSVELVVIILGSQGTGGVTIGVNTLRLGSALGVPVAGKSSAFVYTPNPLVGRAGVEPAQLSRRFYIRRGAYLAGG